MPRQDDKSTYGITEVLGPKRGTNLTVLKKSHRHHLILLYFSIVDLRVLRALSPAILVAQPDSPGQAGIKNVLPNWVMTVPFWRNGYGCQSIKHLRICCRGPSARSSTKLADCVLSLDLLVYPYLMQPF
ncbi:hypothetical protein EDD15DRAFT_2201183 [Pisolithus albus]|nr:hypothetical protein EDD15DRAFT_2201183 [Pisolithus albus]